MPLYDFVCHKCEKVFSILIPLAKYDEKPRCPHCKGELDKMLSAPMFIVR